jgi:hypothetical protein
MGPRSARYLSVGTNSVLSRPVSALPRIQVEAESGRDKGFQASLAELGIRGGGGLWGIVGFEESA